MKILSFAFCTILLSSCLENETPENVLSINKMSPLVEEIMLIETHYQSKYGVPSQYKKALDQSVDEILKKSKTNRKCFERSLAYYAGHPELQKKLNERLLTQLSRKIN